MTLFSKDPDAVLDFAFDWSDWLAVGETISVFTVVAETGLTVDASPAPSESSGVITFWLSSGTSGNSYSVTSQIITSAGRTDDRTMTIRVQER